MRDTSMPIGSLPRTAGSSDVDRPPAAFPSRIPSFVPAQSRSKRARVATALVAGVALGVTAASVALWMWLELSRSLG